ncbi:MAG: hypothetical protein J7L80_02825, partial [Thermoplasmata archaeon]|nr:hypothetical protein [Thermoplasmata archaeon]
MLMPAEMAKINILLHKRDSEKLVEALHKSGLMEIERMSNEELEEAKSHPDTGILASYELRLSRIIEILKNYSPKKRE